MIQPVYAFLALAAMAQATTPTPAATTTPKKPATDLTLQTVKLPGIGARIVTEAPFTLEGKKVHPSNYALGLWPNLDGKGWSIELRRVDIRNVMVRNAMAPLPEGETVYKAPANFETVADTVPRMDVKLVEGDKVANLELRYGNRKLVVPFAR